MLQPCIYYYKWNKKDLKFQRFTIAEGKVGTGLQICTADLDGDGKIDIAVAGKSGTYVLFNRGMTK
ncbi:MAG: VCBS repeat-containing protein [Planctomycetota bacterium]|nr:VCBS repeat-containing protein [Planctomycetota bacterium]